MAAPSHHRYNRQLLVVLGTLVGLLGLFNVSVDPFGIFRNLGLPHLRTYPVIWSRVSAAERISDDCQVALLGSSRVMHGFGPEMPRWGNRKVCNGSVGGTSMVELAEVFDWTVKQPTVQFAIIFLDFHMFHDDRGVNADFAQSRFNDLRTPMTYYSWALTSLDSVKFGARITGNPIRGLDDVHGPVRPSRANRTELYRFLRNKSLFLDWAGSERSVELLEEILDEAMQANVQILLVIPPVHAMVLESMHLASVWEANKQWRRDMVDLLAERAATQPVPLWDFASYHAPARVPMPINPADPVHPYWIDVSHQSRKLGFMTIARIRDAYTGKTEVWEEGFGLLLTPDNLERYLRKLDQGRERWLEEQPDQVTWLYEYAEQLRGVDLDLPDLPEAGAGAQPGLEIELPGMED